MLSTIAVRLECRAVTTASRSRGSSKRTSPPPSPAVPTWVVESICAILAVAALYPLLTPGCLWGHDTGAHLFRLAEVARSLEDGVLYPRFIPDAYGGLGGPVLNFNPVAPYYLPAILVLLGIGPVSALKISAGLMMLAGGGAMLVLARPHMDRVGAAVAALAYVYLPYRIANIYVRMAYSEIVAMVLIPLAMAAARRAARSATAKRLAVAGLAIAAIPAVHFPSSVIGLPLVLVYALWWSPRGGLRKAATSLAAVFALALAMSAFSWLPALLERSETHYEESTAGYDNYRNHFLQPRQLFDPRWGFGSSMPGSDDHMSFQIGWAHVLALLVAAVAAVRVKGLRSIVALGSVVVVMGSILMLAVSRPLWDHLSMLQNVQFPWRLLGDVGVATSLAAGALAGWRSFAVRSGPYHAADLVAAGAVIVLLTAACVPYLQARRWTASDADFTPEAIRRQYFGELKFQPKEVATLHYVPDGPRAALLAGGSASVEGESTHRMTLEVDAPEATTLRVHLFNTPGWKASVDGAAAEVRSEPRTAMVLVDVPAGRHRVELRFADTPVRRISWIVSAAGLLTFGTAMAAGYFRRGLFG
jgi:hypothetical protein